MPKKKKRTKEKRQYKKKSKLTKDNKIGIKINHNKNGNTINIKTSKGNKPGYSGSFKEIF